MDRNLFCAGHCFLPDGRLLVAGGQTNNWFPFLGKQGADHDVHTFDPTTESWSTHEKMPGARWYPTLVTLSDGRALIAAGQANTAPWAANEDYELFDWRQDSKTQPKVFNPGHMGGSHSSYPFMHVIPDGSPGGVLFVHSHRETRLFRPDAMQWDASKFITAGEDRTYPFQGSCVLLPLEADHSGSVRLIAIGGLGELVVEEVERQDGTTQRIRRPDLSPATAKAEIFEFRPDDPELSMWRETAGGSMSSPRFMGDGVLLADGKILVVNGAGKGHASYSSEPVRQPELFDPDGETWTALTPVSPGGDVPRKRLYHSVAVLLQDGSVLVAGNTRDFNPNNDTEDGTLEVYRPPYLFRGPRPVIGDAPEEMTYGRDYSITAHGATATKAALVKLSSTTHTNNLDQRYIRLKPQPGSAGDTVVQSPKDATIATPGYYTLFLLTDDGVPSVGKTVRLG